MYMEDIDLVRRIHVHFKTIYYPFCSIIHKHGKGSYNNKKLLKYHLSSSIQYFNKWGWLFDEQRRKINDKILSQLK
jgi:GT2 family glycosyltransferase